MVDIVDTDSEDDTAAPGDDGRMVDFSEPCIKQEVDTDDTDWRIDTDGHKDPVDEMRAASIDSGMETGDFLLPQEPKVEIISDDDEDDSSDSSDSSSDDDHEDVPSKTKTKSEPIKTANELLHKDLPPVEDIDARVQVILISDWLTQQY